MNHAVSLPTLTFDDRKETNHALYDALVAAVSDINITLPAAQKITLSIHALEEHYDIHISQRGIVLCQYTLGVYPHIFRKIWTIMTLWFVDSEKVETLKNDITVLYHTERIGI